MGARKKKKQVKKKQEEPPPARLATVKATFFSLLGACLILYLAGFFFARTDGFRAYLEDQVERRLGERIEIDSSRSTFVGDLVLGGLTLVGPDEAGESLARAESVRVDMDYGNLLSGGLAGAVGKIEITNWRVDFRADERGQWQPAGLAVAGNWLGQWGGMDVPVVHPGPPSAAGAEDDPDTGDASDEPPALDHIALDLKGGTLVWRARGETVPMAEVQGIRFAQTPLDLPTQNASHYHLHVDDATFAGHGGLHELDVEVLRTGDRYFVLDLEAERRSGGDRTPRSEARRRYPLAAPEDVKIPSTEFDDADALQARIRAELESALAE